MTRSLPLIALPFVALAACAPTQPDDAAGVGFGSYNQPTYTQGPNGQLVANGGPQGMAGGMAAPAASAAPTSVGGEIGAEALQAIGRGPAAGAGQGAMNGAMTSVPQQPPMNSQVQPPMNTASSAPMTATAAPGVAAGSLPVIDNRGRISDENDFSAVSSRTSIDADKQRIEQNAANYAQIAPTALPQRDGNGPNIVEYAVNSRTQLGQQAYGRSSLHITSVERNCGRFASQDLAQIEFLRRGGPERDPGNLDPDGDGYACLWDPRPFQKR